MRPLHLLAILAAVALSFPLRAAAQAPPAKGDKADKGDKQDKKLLKELEEKEDLEEEEAGRGGLEDLLDSVVVTATKREQPISAAPAIITVITDRQIKQRGYRTVAEALDSVPGLYGISDHVQWNLGVRGINGGTRAGSRIVKVMIDGQPISFRPSTENWLGEELIPIAAVRRIEIIRGPSSALYGANAFLGVVNIITTSGAIVDGARVGGSFNLVRGHPGGGGSVVVGAKTGTTDILVAGTGVYTDRSGITIANVPKQTLYGANAKSVNDSATPASLFFKLMHTSRIFGNLSLDLSYQRLQAIGEFMDWGPLAQGSQQLAGYVDPEIKNRVGLQNLYARARLSRTFLENFSFALSGTFATMGPTSADRLAISQKGLAEWVTRDVSTTGFDVVTELSYTAKNVNTFTIGVDLTNDRQQLLNYYGWTRSMSGPQLNLAIAPLRTQPFGSDTFRNIGTYIQAVVYPTVLFGSQYLTTLGLTGGFRYDNHNIYGGSVNGRAGLVYLWNKIYGKALFGTSFKAPASMQLFTMLLQPGDVLGNRDLKPETAKTVEFLVGGDFFSGFNAEVNAFYSLVDDKVEITSDPRSANLSAQNVASIRGFGVEGNVTYNWRDLTSYLNFSYQKTTSKTKNPLTGKEAIVDAQVYPTFMLKFGVGYQIPKIHLGAFAEGRFITSRLSSTPNAKVYDSITENPYSLDSYFNLDLSLSTVDLKLVPGRETFLQAKLYNVIGKDYLYPGFRDFDIPSLGRVFLLTLTQQI
jgi:iron complex outermembrane receptor protein